ncbi:MAG: hypothetical protein HUU46_21965 [Candidatus Hydrogenedentes bacterium]|nr:hypothetical protein [Candidatus Hydrogenedentota bacterium]
MSKPYLTLIAIAFAALRAAAQPQGAVAAPDAVTLADATPSFRAPFLPPPPNSTESAQSIRLLGVDVVQDGKVLIQTPELDGEKPAKLVTYWCANAKVDSRLALALQFLAIRGRLTRTLELTAGPEPGQAAWERGTVHRVEHTLDLPDLSQDISGRLDLVINSTSLAAGGFAYAPLQSVPILLQPRVQPGRASRSRFDALFSAGYAALDVSFRLGAGATHPVAIPEAWRDRVGRIAVISAFSFGPIAQEKPVCNVTARRGETEIQRWTMRSGVDTARTDIDYYPPDQQEHKKVAIVESIDADYPDKNGSPFKRHMYIGWLDVTPESLPIDAVTFASSSDYFFDVFDIVLVPRAAP